MSNVPTPSTPSDHYENQSVQLLRRIAGEPFMPASAPTALTKYEKYKAEENRLLGEIAEIIAGATSWIGVTTTALTDGAITNPITINGESVTAVAGNITSYGADEFIFNGAAWQLFGAANAAPLVCTFSKSGKNIVCDKTQNEIVAAYEAKKAVLAYVPDTVVGNAWPTIGDQVLRLAGVTYSNNKAIIIEFGSEYRKAADGGVSASCGVLSLSSTFVIAAWSSWVAAYRVALPPVSSSDDGKFLGVSSGDWAAVTLPTELPPVTSSDNGKDLSVVDGAWAAKMKDPLVVTYTIIGAAVGGQYPLSANHTFDEIMSAYGAGRDVLAKCMIPIGSNAMEVSTVLNEVLYDGNPSSPTYDEPLFVMFGISGIEQGSMTGLVGSVRHRINDTATLALDYFPLNGISVPEPGTGADYTRNLVVDHDGHVYWKNEHLLFLAENIYTAGSQITLEEKLQTLLGVWIADAAQSPGTFTARGANIDLSSDNVFAELLSEAAIGGSVSLFVDLGQFAIALTPTSVVFNTNVPTAVCFHVSGVLQESGTNICVNTDIWVAHDNIGISGFAQPVV